jgi:hypothetical protein
MPSAESVEHFVTLFDSKFLPSGLALHASMCRHLASFHLWILCMDEAVEQQLTALDLPRVTLISLQNFETAELRGVKPSRTQGEYCWTVTSFTFQAVFTRDPTVARATYLDADLFFYRSPATLLDEFTASGKDVLITEHAFAPEYDQAWKGGRFCVQFLTCRNTPGGRKVIDWWQQRCLEWCYARLEDGKYGDQKYLDHWPEIFPSEVHILAQTQETLGPWNVRFFLHQSGFRYPVFFHFHGLRITEPCRAVLYSGYRIGTDGERLYEEYLESLRQAIALLRQNGIPIPSLPQRSLRARLKTVKNILLGRYRDALLT